MDNTDNHGKEQRIGYKNPPKQFQWKKGQSGNLAGRPPGKTLKEFAREYLLNLPDDRKVEYLETLPTEIVWKMAEGNPKDEVKVKAELTISDVLDELENGHKTKGQTMEDKTPLQDTQQSGAVSPVQVQPHTDALQPELAQPQPDTQI